MLNFIGPNQGIKIYYDGNNVKNDAKKHQQNYTQGDVRIVVERRFSHLNQRYATLLLDELLFFDQALTVLEIGKLCKYESVHLVSKICQQ